jgi:monofunctional biosynthetic peptidoglycan transglycosylase
MTAPGRLRVWLKRAAIAIGLAFLATQLWFLGCVVYWKWQNPGMTAFMQEDRARVEKLAPGKTARPQQHVWVDYAHISSNLKRAVITSEDARFITHDGVDWDAMGRAYELNLHRGHASHGGSTITQQLAKNLFLTPKRSYWRKAQELLITFMIEACWNKKRILEVYLNVVEWGDGIYGAEAGARHYFGVAAAALDAEQAARMAAMLPNPRFFDRHRDVPYLDQRAQSIERYEGYAQIP